MNSGITGTNSYKNSRGRREVAQSNQQPEFTRSENEQKSVRCWESKGKGKRSRVYANSCTEKTTISTGFLEMNISNSNLFSITFQIAVKKSQWYKPMLARL